MFSYSNTSSSRDGTGHRASIVGFHPTSSSGSGSQNGGVSGAASSPSTSTPHIKRSKSVTFDPNKLAAIHDCVRNLIKIDTERQTHISRSLDRSVDRLNEVKQMLKEEFMKQKEEMEKQRRSLFVKRRLSGETIPEESELLPVAPQAAPLAHLVPLVPSVPLAPLIPAVDIVKNVDLQKSSSDQGFESGVDLSESDDPSVSLNDIKEDSILESFDKDDQIDAKLSAIPEETLDGSKAQLDETVARAESVNSGSEVDSVYGSPSSPSPVRGNSENATDYSIPTVDRTETVEEEGPCKVDNETEENAEGQCNDEPEEDTDLLNSPEEIRVPADVPADIPLDAPMEAPAKVSVDAPEEVPVDAPMEAPVETEPAVELASGITRPQNDAVEKLEMEPQPDVTPAPQLDITPAKGQFERETNFDTIKNEVNTSPAPPSSLPIEKPDEVKQSVPKPVIIQRNVLLKKTPKLDGAAATVMSPGKTQMIKVSKMNIQRKQTPKPPPAPIEDEKVPKVKEASKNPPTPDEDEKVPKVKEASQNQVLPTKPEEKVRKRIPCPKLEQQAKKTVEPKLGKEKKTGIPGLKEEEQKEKRSSYLKSRSQQERRAQAAKMEEQKQRQQSLPLPQNSAPKLDQDGRRLTKQLVKKPIPNKHPEKKPAEPTNKTTKDAKKFPRAGSKEDTHKSVGSGLKRLGKTGSKEDLQKTQSSPKKAETKLRSKSTKPTTDEPKPKRKDPIAKKPPIQPGNKKVDSKEPSSHEARRPHRHGQSPQAPPAPGRRSRSKSKDRTAAGSKKSRQPGKVQIPNYQSQPAPCNRRAAPGRLEIPQISDPDGDKVQFIHRKSPNRLTLQPEQLETEKLNAVVLRPLNKLIQVPKSGKTGLEERVTLRRVSRSPSNHQTHPQARSASVDVGALSRNRYKKWKPRWRRSEEEEGDEEEEEEAEAEEAPSQAEAEAEETEEPAAPIEEEVPKEEEKPKPKIPSRQVEDAGASNKTEAELAMLAQKRKHEEEEEAKLAHYEEQRRIQREKEEEELRLLKEKQERRKREREEEEQIMAERKKQDEERRRQEDEERKAKIEADRQKKEEEKRKRQALMAGLQASGGPNFEITKKDAQAEKFDKFGNIVKAKAEMGLTKEQQEEQKKKAMADLCKPMDTAGLSVEALRAKIKELHARITRLEGVKYDLEKRSDRQEYDLKELNERQRQISRNKALKKGLNPDEVTNSPHPPKVPVASKYDRQIDRRSYHDRFTMFEHPSKPKKPGIHHGSCRPPNEWGRKESEELENLRKNLEPPKYQEAVKIEGARPPMEPVPPSIEEAEAVDEEEEEEE